MANIYFGNRLPTTKSKGYFVCDMFGIFLPSYFVGDIWEFLPDYALLLTPQIGMCYFSAHYGQFGGVIRDHNALFLWHYKIILQIEKVMPMRPLGSLKFFGRMFESSSRFWG